MYGEDAGSSRAAQLCIVSNECGERSRTRMPSLAFERQAKVNIFHFCDHVSCPVSMLCVEVDAAELGETGLLALTPS